MAYQQQVAQLTRDAYIEKRISEWATKNNRRLDPGNVVECITSELSRQDCIVSCARCGLPGHFTLADGWSRREHVYCLVMETNYCKSCHSTLHRHSKSPKGRLLCEL